VTPRKAAPADGAAASGYLRVAQMRSSIGSKPKHRGTLRALGLRGIGSARVLPDRPEVRGMVARVPHLVDLRPASEDEVAAERARRAAFRRSGAALKEGEVSS
jgi:large subunit ribosomal protein L30